MINSHVSWIASYQCVIKLSFAGVSLNHVAVTAKLSFFLFKINKNSGNKHKLYMPENALLNKKKDY